jgi:NAD(P)-dependent dehydrogenase (short-subunit alcohol dehydrogenase family)
MSGIENFEGRVVAVTGAASGIGRAIALAFAKRGARLVLADIDKAGLLSFREELADMGAEAYAQVLDVSLAGDVERFCENIYREMGRVDVLCNNAGVALAGGIEDMTLDDWDWVVGVNLQGVIHGCHYFYPRMIEQGGGGHIVNTASYGGLGPFPALTAYCCTKYGVVGLSESLRAEAAPYGIGVTALCPGAIATPIVRKSKIVSSTKSSAPEELVKKTDWILTRRNYAPERVAEAVVKAVRKNKGIARVTAETRIMDWLHRISRSGFHFLHKIAVKVADTWM